MKIVNLDKGTLAPGWVVSQLPPAIHPTVAGLTASFILKGTFEMRHGAAAERWKPTWCSGDQPFGGNPALGLGYASDFIPYKPQADFAVVGSACAPSAGLTSFRASARVGAKLHEIEVIGDRQWRSSLAGAYPGSPAPITRLPLSYTYAWGGAGFFKNPLGCGWDGDRMPNFELPGMLVTSRKSSAGPAGFAPIPADWPLRREKLGTYDGRWVRDRWPWFPEDFDWTYFNAAPPAQWMDGYLRGDEDVECVNLHASTPRYKTRLPGLRARCFLLQTIGGQEVFHEVPLDLDTLWMDMEHEKMTLVWRGRAATDSLKLRDIAFLLLASESLDSEQCSLAHYREKLAQSLARKTPTPTSPSPPDPLREAEARQDAASAERKEEILRRFAEMEKNASTKQQEKLQTLQRLGEAAGRPPVPPREVPGRSILDGPVFAAASPDQQATITGAFSFFEGEGGIAAKAEAEFASLRAAFENEPPAEVPEQKCSPARRPRTRQNLRGADFSGQDLTGRNFSGAILAGANFSRSRLVGANFTGTNLSGADLRECDFTRADFTRSDLHGCQASGAVWVHACLAGAAFCGVVLEGADFSRAHGARADFSKACLVGAKFVEADLPRATFSGARLDRADFSRARLSNASFARAKACGVVMDDAVMDVLRAGKGADFSGGSFRRAHAPGSIWKGAVLEGADFLQAHLRRAIFGEARMCQAKFDRCDLAEAVFEDACLQRAVLTHANLLRAVFDRADLTGATLDGANLFEAGMWGTTWLHASWKGANIKRTRLAALP